MRKTGWQILAEIRESLAVIEGKIAEVELQLSELEGFMEFEEDDEPVEIPEPVIAPEPEPEVVVEPEAVILSEAKDLPSEPEPALDVVVPEPEFDPAPAAVPDPSASLRMTEVSEPEPVILSEAKDLPSESAPQPAESINEAARPKAAVIDVMAEKCAWKTDIPGSPVRNIISGISLNDRILFINSLFKGDAQAFQATIALFNTYEKLEEAEAFIRSNYPGWNLDSEVVYRFMMAVRRKLGK